MLNSSLSVSFPGYNLVAQNDTDPTLALKRAAEGECWDSTAVPCLQPARASPLPGIPGSGGGDEKELRIWRGNAWIG